MNDEYKKIKLPYMNPEIVADDIGNFVLHRVRKANATGCVIGLSGGIDSTATAAVIKRAFDIRNYGCIFDDEKFELVGYILPSKINSDTDTEDGIRVAKSLGIRYEVISLDKDIEGFRSTNPEAFESSYHLGNLISRIRANVLNTKGATEKKIVAGTGNKDEDFAVGYYTMFGDGAVHMSPIGNLSKRLVRELATYLGVDKDLVYREPSAGLELGQTDFKDLGYGYDVVELVTEGLIQGCDYEALVKHPQIKPLVESQIKIQDNPKLKSVEEIVDDILRRHTIAELKAEVIHPPKAPITLEYR
ncbi:MAG: NAD(+) synthase [Candidatus Woesearchaeota archaeon]